MGKVFNWECSFVKGAKKLFLSVNVDDIKMAGKTENIKATGKILMKDVDLEEPTSFFGHMYLGSCTIDHEIVTKYKDKVEVKISVGVKENYLQKLHGNMMQKTYLFEPAIWKVMKRNVWKDITNLRIKLLNNCTKSRHHAQMTIHLKKKKISQ